jgi:hypothetical protein
VARFRTRRCCGTAEEDALQHLELRPIGFSDTGWIVSDAAGDGRNCAVAVRAACASGHCMEERVGLIFGESMLF